MNVDDVCLKKDRIEKCHKVWESIRISFSSECCRDMSNY